MGLHHTIIKSVLILCLVKTEQKFQPLAIIFFRCFWTNPLQVKPTTSPALLSGWWMMAALKTCMRWEVDHVYFGILVVTHDAWLKGSGFTVCVFSDLFASWPSTESCPEMPPEALSGSQAPSREAPPSVVVCKKGLWELACWFMEIPHCLR